MSKYDEFYYQNPTLSLEQQLLSGENKLWSGKPEKKAFIINKCLTMLPFAILWLTFDSIFILGAFATGTASIFFVLFFALHLMPVWIWLSNVLTASKQWHNTEYLVTNRRILIKSGFLTKNITTINYKDVDSINSRIGIVDNILHVGDIYISAQGSKFLILDIKEPTAVANKLQKIILDMQTDITYPNALRPDTNPGYNSEYTNNN